MALPDKKSNIQTQNRLKGDFDREKYSVLDKLSDQQIFDKFKNGDRLAFTYIYNKYVNPLFNFGRQFSTDQELIKDCIHDLFIRLRRPGKKVKILSIKSYLYKCLYHDLIKKLDKEKKPFEADSGLPNFHIALSHEHTLINQQITNARRENLEHSLNRLSEKQRRAVLLYFYEELSYKEISEVFGMSNVKSARKLIYRAMDKLKELIRPIY
ncbi:MAG: RNA polymerase sigma factor [Bacteroidota bacterium]